MPPNKDERNRSEEAFEFGYDDAFDVPADVSEGAENVSALGWPLIAKSYMRGRLEIHLHFRLVEPEVAEYCAVCKRLEERNLRASDDGRVHNERTTCPPLAPAVGNARADGSNHTQTLVPVYASEFVEEKEGMLVRITTHVRLQLLDSCSYLRVHRPDLVHPSSGVVPVGGVFVGLLEGLAASADREADGSLVRLSGAQGGESPGEVFEGASHVLKGVSDNDSQEQRRLLAYLSPEDMLAAVRVWLVGNSVRLSGVKGGKLFAERFQVVTCPVELQTSTSEGIGHGER